MQKFPVIVLEGPDCTGKTTLAQNLATRMGGKYLHLTYRWPGKMHHYHQSAMELALRWSQRQPVVLDRWWPSEVVYASAFRGGTPWPMASRMFERVALKHRFLYVLSMPKDKQQYLDFYQKTKSASEDVLGPRDRLFDLYQAWEVRQQLSHNLLRFDLFNDPRTAYVQIAEQAWRQLDPFATNLLSSITRPDPFDRRLAGSHRARFVLVGDQSNPKSRRPAWPFFEHANSSLWVTQKLEELGLPEVDLVWVNLHDQYGDPQVGREELRMLFAGRHSVSFGDKVLKTLSRWDLKPTYQVKHPQYYRRFTPNTRELNFLGTIYGRNKSYERAARDLGLVRDT